jgi:hypothetical protein
MRQSVFDAIQKQDTLGQPALSQVNAYALVPTPQASQPGPERAHKAASKGLDVVG